MCFHSKYLFSIESWVGSLLAIGAFFGAIPAGILADMIGRKYINMALGVPFLISWGLIISASNVGMLYAGRIFAGTISPTIVSIYQARKPIILAITYFPTNWGS